MEHEEDGMKKIALYFVAAICVAGAPAKAFSQAPTTNIAGVVVDQNGNPVSRVQIFAKDAAGKILAQGITDDAGRYCLTGLPTGQYTLVDEPPPNVVLKSEPVVTNLPVEGLKVDWNLSAASALANAASPGVESCKLFLAGKTGGGGIGTPALVGLGVIGAGGAVAGIVCGTGNCGESGHAGVASPSK